MAEYTNEDVCVDGVFYSFPASITPARAAVWESVQLANEVDRFELPRGVVIDSELARLRAANEQPPVVREVLQREDEFIKNKQRTRPDRPATGVDALDGYFKLRSPKVEGMLSARVHDAWGSTCTLTGRHLYLPGGFREWHTNIHNVRGWRAYFIDVDAPMKSFFRFIHPENGEMHTVWDFPGRLNVFLIDPQRPLFHCITSRSAVRLSTGLLVSDQIARRLIDPG